MSALPQKPVEAPKKIQKLLKKYNAREAYDILAARIILANERIRDTLPPSRVQTRTQETRSRVQSKSQGLSLTAKDLEDLRTGRYGRIQLPSQEEARYWLKRWREAAMPKEEIAIRQNLARRKPPEVRE